MVVIRNTLIFEATWTLGENGNSIRSNGSREGFKGLWCVSEHACMWCACVCACVHVY